MTQPDFEQRKRDAVSRALTVVDAWALSDDQACRVLGGLTNARLLDLRRQGAIGAIDPSQVSEDLFVRATLVNGIDESLHILFPVADRANGWIQRPNDGPGFGGRPALELMLESVDQLDYVCRYLKGWAVS
jgi:hypothetical protein